MPEISVNQHKKLPGDKCGGSCRCRLKYRVPLSVGYHRYVFVTCLHLAVKNIIVCGCKNKSPAESGQV